MTSRHVLVVGAGPGGLAAAEAALAAGARVTLVDTADQPGGQYHRTPPEAYAADHPERRHRAGRPVPLGLSPSGPRHRARLRGPEDGASAHSGVLDHPRCTWWPRTSVWALERPDFEHPGPPRVHLLRGPADGAGRRRQVCEADALVLATGAHDRVLPFPGWQLPGVFTGGAAQALVKGERVVIGDRVLVAGTGPFLLPVAAALLESGTRVLAVLEANGAAAVARGWLRRPWRLPAHTGKAGELAGYAATLARHRVPYVPGLGVVAARGDGRVAEVVTARLGADWSVVPGSERVRAVDAVCVTHGFSPRLELAVAAGCALHAPWADASADLFVTVDDDQRTSCPGVYAAGEITGVAGAPAARAEGAVAGWLAAGGPAALPALRRLRRLRDRGRDFGARLAGAHPIGAAWPGWLTAQTVVCRCEGTDYASVCRAVDAAAGVDGDTRVVRLASRAGLGPCQARICGPTLTELTERLRGAGQGRPAGPAASPAAHPHHRPIAQPIRLGELARRPEPLPDRPEPPAVP